MSIRRFFTADTSERGSRHSGRRNQRNRRNLVFQTAEARCMMAADGFDFCTFDQVDPRSGVIAAEVASNDLAAEQAPTANSPQPVLLVIANQDFWYQDYSDTRAALEAQGLEVIVAATSTQLARPHANSGQSRSGGLVQPDVALSSADAADYSAIAFVGGWGMSSYQYAFEGTYGNSTYNGNLDTKQVVNDLINNFVDQDKYVAAICYGVSVLAYARVDGQSLIAGREVAGFNGPAPWAHGISQTSRSQIESSGAIQVASGSVGDPNTAADDVIVDGRIITAENYDSASAFGSKLAEQVIAAAQPSHSIANPATANDAAILQIVGKS